MWESVKQYWTENVTKPRVTVPVVRLSGVVGSFGGWPRGLSLVAAAPALERAFKMRRAPAVALVVNSPGGSAVQANLIYTRIRELADLHKKPVHVFVEDVAASGGYWMALAGDDIYVDASSIVGSIGVVAAGFGFVDAIGKIGVERRIYTAGDRKRLLDPFEPVQTEDLEHLKGLQADIHAAFIAHVRNRRGTALKEDQTDLFSGLFWTGARALEYGLIDGIGELRTILREKYGPDVHPRLIAMRRRAWPFGGSVTGGAFAHAVETLPAHTLAALEERALWNRFGL